MKQSYIDSIDVLIAIFWLAVIIIISNSAKSRIKNKEVKAYYNYALFFKLFLALIYALVYIYYFGGGDTTAYWDGAVSLNKLLFHNPTNFIEHLISEPTEVLRIKHFSKETGYPPGWIYREQEAWFVCKVTSFVSLIAFRSYLAGTFIYAYAVAAISMKLFDLVYRMKLHTIRTLAFAILFIPSVAFWCSGVSKDTLTYWSILQMLVFFLSYFVFNEPKSIWNWTLLALSVFILYHTRVFILVATIIPLAMAYSTRLTKKYEDNAFVKFSIRILIITGGFGFFFLFLRSGFANELVSEAQIVQQDFKNNVTYTGKRYEINTTDASPTGLLRAFPISVFYGIYKPLPYEALSPTLIFNGIESAILLYLTLLFLFQSLFKNIRIITSNEFLVFSFLFVILIGFMAGFSSVLYGVLVRIRAPLLPFIFLILTTRKSEIKNSDTID
jgi:hypothetical protein